MIGREDAPTRPLRSEIAEVMVPVGALELDRDWIAHSDEAATLDRFYREVLDSLNT